MSGNVRHRGIDVYPAGGPWEEPVNVFAWNPTTSTWVLDRSAWTWDPAIPGWREAFGQAAANSSAQSFFYFTSGLTQATVQWTLPTPNNADEWRIARGSDGALVGTVDGSLNTFTDPDPLPLNNYYYTVAPYLNGITPGALATATRDLRLLPTGFAASYNSGTGLVDIVGTQNALGKPDTYFLFLTDLDDPPSSNPFFDYAGPLNIAHVTPDGSGGITYSYDLSYASIPSHFRGHRLKFYAVADLSGYYVMGGAHTAPLSDGVISAEVDVPGLAPTLVSFGPPAGSHGILTLTWTRPNGWSGPFRVESSPDGSTWSTVVFPYATLGENPGVVDLRSYSTTVPGYMRVRSEPPGGVSAWLTAGPATPNP